MGQGVRSGRGERKVLTQARMIKALVFWQILLASNAMPPVGSSSVHVYLAADQALIFFLLLECCGFFVLLLTGEPPGTIGDQNLFSSLDRLCGTYLHRVSVSTFPNTKQGGTYLYTGRFNLSDVTGIVPNARFCRPCCVCQRCQVASAWWIKHKILR